MVKCVNPFKVQERPKVFSLHSEHVRELPYVISMNCIAQLLLTAFDLIQVNFLGFNLFLLLDPKVKSDHNTFLKRECKIYEKLQWNIVAAELSNLRSFPNLVSNKFARCVLWWMIKTVSCAPHFFAVYLHPPPSVIHV